MTDDFERFLGEAFDARARAEVPEHRTPPPMRLPDHLSPHRHRSGPSRRARWLAPLAAAAAVLLVVGTVFALTRNSSSDRHGAIGSPSVGGSPSHSGATSGSPTPTSTSTAPSKAPAKPVHVSLKFGDGQVLGVGIPIIAFLSRPIADARGFA
ncbi:MAG: hypothetical protein ACRDVG_06375, partial [Jatrophihabitantaceae bacterium]